MKKLNKTLNVVNHLTCYHCHTLMHDFIRVIMQLQAQPSEKKKKKHPKNSQPTYSDNGEMIQDAQQGRCMQVTTRDLWNPYIHDIVRL